MVAENPRFCCKIFFQRKIFGEQNRRKMKKELKFLFCQQGAMSKKRARDSLPKDSRMFCKRVRDESDTFGYNQHHQQFFISGRLGIPLQEDQEYGTYAHAYAAGAELTKRFGYPSVDYDASEAVDEWNLLDELKKKADNLKLGTEDPLFWVFVAGGMGLEKTPNKLDNAHAIGAKLRESLMLGSMPPKQ